MYFNSMGSHTPSLRAERVLQDIYAIILLPRLPQLQPPPSMSYDRTQIGDTTSALGIPERGKNMTHTRAKIRIAGVTSE